MKPEEDDLYWKYVIARFAAYRNIWWSLANEFDLFEEKKCGRLGALRKNHL